MPTQDAPAGLISQQVFDQYSSKWVEVIGNSDTTLLNQCFRAPEQKLAYVTFPALQIARLVSTVGARHIKARFLVATETRGELLFPHFTLALFATDDLNARLSSYYLADAYWENPPAEPTKNDLIPNILVNYWLHNWAGEPAVAQAMFNSPYGFLRGYTFALDDFLAPLAQAKDLAGSTLRVSFGLHEYYSTGSDGQDALTSTFGLVVQYFDGLGDPLDDPAFDMAHPCPPTC